PDKGAMLTQALTQPFKVVSVGLSDGRLPALVLPPDWPAVRRYRVTQGSFEQSGGIAGRVEQFQPGGAVQIMRLGKLVTVGFGLTATGASKRRELGGYATGLASDGGSFRLPRLDAGTFVDQPNGGLSATGRFSDGDNRLSLTFEPLPDNVADGFDGRGKLEAASAPAPKASP
ncbi:MAG TPA: hypothetical protein VER08_05950, partial [Pyrinomonadaceae bacterium]|nr:hypothetical protein [Pyrinomonadaceae bacterium]